MSGAFVSHDGQGTEVWVQTGRGKIVELDTGNNSSARVTVKGEGLRYKTHGWVPKNDPIFAKIQEAYDQGREINYRIESQRKKSVDKTTPINELRATMELAKENIIQIFAGIDGELSSEHLTNPSKDTSGGRVPDTGDSSSQNAAPTGGTSIDLDALEERLSALLVSPHSDFSAAIAVEDFVRTRLVKLGFEEENLNQETGNLSVALIKVVDDIQKTVFGGVDRSAVSHEQVRTVVFSTIDNEHPLPVNDDDSSDWSSSLRATSLQRLRLVYSLATGSAATKQSSTVTNPSQAPVATSEPAVQSDDDQVEVFQPVEDNASDERATDATISALKKLVAEAGVTDMSLVTGILKYTFGTGTAKSVSDSNLGDFVDFYVDSGAEKFSRVLQQVANR